MTGVASAGPRRAGRPRAVTPQTPSLSPREDVLAAAAALFVEQGYAATSTRAIADVVGLRQASLFHYFEKKEDILAELLDRTLRPAVAFARWLSIESRPGPAALHALAWTDAYNLAASPNNLASLQLLPETRQPRFDGFWATREELRQHYGTHVRASLDSAPPEPAELDLIFGLVESVLMPYPSLRRLTSAEIADAVATSALRITGVPQRRVGASAKESRRLRDQFAAAQSD